MRYAKAIISFAIVFLIGFFLGGWFLMPHLPPFPEHAVSVFDSAYWTTNWVGAFVGLLFGSLSVRSILRQKCSEPGFPIRLVIKNAYFALDGGTTDLVATDQAGYPHRARLNQNMFPKTNPSLADLPGRLYFDGKLVPIRSDLEAKVLALLRSAELRYEGTNASSPGDSQLPSKALILGKDINQAMAGRPEDYLRQMRDIVIEYVSSSEYEMLAAKIERQGPV